MRAIWLTPLLLSGCATHLPSSSPPSAVAEADLDRVRDRVIEERLLRPHDTRVEPDVAAVRALFPAQVSTDAPHYAPFSAAPSIQVFSGSAVTIGALLDLYHASTGYLVHYLDPSVRDLVVQQLPVREVSAEELLRYVRLQTGVAVTVYPESRMLLVTSAPEVAHGG